jgi:hypothetical protein
VPSAGDLRMNKTDRVTTQVEVDTLMELDIR